MTTITREWLQKTIADMESARDDIPFGLDEDDRNTLAALRIALASLEAEPVAYMHRSGQVVTREECCDDKTFAICCKVEKPLYTSQPALVSVPDLKPVGFLFVSDDGAVAYSPADWPMKGFNLIGQIYGDLNACLAAMLQGKATGNSPVIPDGSEDTKRLDWLDTQNKRLNEYYGTSYGWKFDANFQRNAMMLNDSNYPVMTVRQAIDQAIAAVPKQETL